MTTVSNLEAELREISGTGQARATRRAGFIPGVIYGGDKPTEMCAVDQKMVTLELHKPGFFTKIFTLSLEGKSQQVMAKDIQLHPVSDQLLHIDFIRVSKSTKVTVAVPVAYINEDKAPGIKRGGVLNVLVRDLEVHAPATNIPEEIVIDLAGLNIHDSIHVDAVKFPAGVSAAHPERDYTLATITAPTTEESGGEAGREENAAS